MPLALAVHVCWHSAVCLHLAAARRMLPHCVCMQSMTAPRLFRTLQGTSSVATGAHPQEMQGPESSLNLLLAEHRYDMKMQIIILASTSPEMYRVWPAMARTQILGLSLSVAQIYKHAEGIEASAERASQSLPC